MSAWQKQAQKKYAHAKHKNKPNQAHEAIVSKEQVVQQFHDFSGCEFLKEHFLHKPHLEPFMSSDIDVG